ncbi:MAG: class I SAM-dependent methyltransferase, partial [Vicinamibacterales bacterium]
FVKDRGIPSLGIEPTAGTAEAARAKGIEVVVEFFGFGLADRLVAEGRAADLMAANNVLAHVPDINDFVAGFARLLKPQGVATFEFPHLLKLVEDCQFDTVYHEHFSYLSLAAVDTIFGKNGLSVFDVEELSTHGGSLRVFAQRSDGGRREATAAVGNLRAAELAAGVTSAAYYTGFQTRAETVKDDLLAFLLDARRSRKRVVGYGAAAKGNTLLNFAGVRPDLLSWVVDRNPAKKDKFLPGSRIPVVGEDRLHTERPDYVLVLPWNLRAEISEQLGYVRRWGGRLVTAVPHLEVV